MLISIAPAPRGAQRACSVPSAHVRGFFFLFPCVFFVFVSRYAYHLLVDGNGALNRLARYLCSGSLALLGGVMQEWYFR